jgi:hypothetical protein
MEQLSDGLVTGGLVANEWVRDSWRVLVHLKWER